MVAIKTPRKLIEVALPLDDINEAAAREKSIRHGHPSTLHLWWARRPLAAARAVLFAQMVNDPGYETGNGFTRGMNKKDAARERERLFNIIRRLVQWENTNNEAVLEEAREEIRKSWRETCELNAKHPQAAELFNPDKLPAFHDPFAGGGAIPLEAQRLGLESHASDLNPVAVLINKAMIEIPPKFAGRKPVGPVPPGERQARIAEDWSGARGLAEDLRRYGHWMREEAQKRIGHLYPDVEITAAMAAQRPDLKPLVGQKLTVIAWLWARTIKSTNPAYARVAVPLVSSFVVSSKKGKEAWVDPVIRSDGTGYDFVVKTTGAPRVEETVNRSGATCVMSGTAIPFKHLREEAKKGAFGTRLMAIVAQGVKGRVYLSPDAVHEAVATSANGFWKPDVTICHWPGRTNVVEYGMTTFGDLFTPRQLVALTTFSHLVSEARELVRADALKAGMPDDGRGLEAEGTGATAYAEAVGAYLALATDKCADYNSSICGWISGGETLRSTFGRQAIPMVWDFCEAQTLGSSTGSFSSVIEQMAKALSLAPAIRKGQIIQHDAQSVDFAGRVVSTDPPYYDNIGYADLSDFFYVWLRRAARSTFPQLFATVAVPKAEELVATPYRHGGVNQAEAFFLDGMTKAMGRIASTSNPCFPVSIYYAFKQAETKEAGTSSTGWETFLQAVIMAGFSIGGTWPVRTERENRSIGIGANALASSIVLVCRKRPSSAQTVSRRDFLRELKNEMTEAIEAMLGGADGASPVAPVDLAQAAIGPGMAVFSRYAAVLEANGEPMTVHTALTLINKQVDEVLGGETFDADTNFCLGWFQEVGWSSGAFGEANTLAQAKATSVPAVEKAGVIESKGGKVKLLKPVDYPADWDPSTDTRTPVWEALHQLIRALTQGGESVAGSLLARMPERAGDIRRLAFWLYTLCERKGWAEDARAYNELVTAWHAIEAASQDVGQRNEQMGLEL